MITKRQQRILWGLGVLLLVSIALSLFTGRYPSPYWMPPRLLVEDTLAQRLVVNLRMPRIVVAMLLGMSLAGAGTVMQMIFHNPLVEPGFLGVSQGASFGAALSIVALNASGLGIQAAAACFGCMGLVLSYSLATRIRYGGWTLRLVLAGLQCRPCSLRASAFSNTSLTR